MPGSEGRFTKQERATLRALAEEAWEAELRIELEVLFEDFCKWADHGLSSFDLSDKIHEFDCGTARDLFKRYQGLSPSSAAARAVAIGLLREGTLDEALGEKLADEIEFFRRVAEEDRETD